VHDDTRKPENTGLPNTEFQKIFQEMIVPIGNSLSELVSSDHGDDGEDEADEETEQGQLSEDDNPSWVMGTITKTAQQCTEWFWHMQMTLEELT
jgi:hypothetical protein